MLIDWFTVGAQALNFLVLVWLLKRFLYKPILNAIDAREKGIAAKLADADAKKAESQKERDDFQDKNKVFDEQRAALLGKATDEAKVERERLLGEAHQDSDSLRATAQTALHNEWTRLGDHITRVAKEEVFEIARKTLADLATISLEERLVEVFTRRLREMDGGMKERLAAALKTASGPALVRSVFELPSAQKAAIQNALNETFSAEIPIRFETADDELCGIELTAHGQKIGWSIAGYLASLDQKVGSLLDAQSKPMAKDAPQPETTQTAEALAYAGAK